MKFSFTIHLKFLSLVLCSCLANPAVLWGQAAEHAATQSSTSETHTGETQLGETQPINADLLLSNGVLHRGDGEPGVVGSVAISKGKIVAIGEFPVGQVGQVLDCSGLIICPGFIDLHNHSDEDLLAPHTRSAMNYVMQGCTTLVTGNCGFGPLDVRHYFHTLQSNGVGVNVAHLVPQGSVRRHVVGSERRGASPEELVRMRELVRRMMEEGAVGMSTGLIYVPSSYASTEEIIELAKEVAAADGIYVSHIRNENTELLAAIDEILAIGRAAQLPVHVSHFKSSGKEAWGLVRLAVQKLAAARDAGQEVTADQYPYTASSTSLDATLVPDWARAGDRAAMLARLNNPDTQGPILAAMRKKLAELDDGQRVQIASYAAQPEWAGKRLAEIARQREQEALEVVLEILGQGGASIVNHSINEEDVRFVMQVPWVATASDGGTKVPDASVPHPRSYGTFPRKIGYYAVRQQVVPLRHAIRSATGLPADILSLTDRGYLRVGMAADVIVFDRDEFIDQATFVSPHQYATGLSHAFVNGVPVVIHGRATGTLPGRPLHHARRTRLSESQMAELREVLSPWDHSAAPGCLVRVMRDGRVLFQHAVGAANLDDDQPLEAFSRFYLASVSKQFVAAAVGLLATEGRLSLHDDVRQHVPELPEFEHPIQIQHLVYHTSGLHDYFDLMAQAEIPLAAPHTTAEVLGLVYQHKALDFAPGERYQYSNTGYLLLGEIVRRVSGQSLADFARERIFSPLGMTETSFHDDHRRIVPHRVISYRPKGQTFEVAYLSEWDLVGSGGVVSTAEDLARWADNFRHHRVGGDELHRLQHTNGRLNSGEQIAYQLGQVADTYAGRDVFQHAGSFMGFRTYLGRIPDESLDIVVLANRQDIDPVQVAHRVMDICFHVDQP